MSVSGAELVHAIVRAQPLPRAHVRSPSFVASSCQETAVRRPDVYALSDAPAPTHHPAERSCAMRSNALIVGSLFITAALLVGCSSSGASASAPAAATAAPASVAPASEAPASAAASAAASAPAGVPPPSTRSRSDRPGRSSSPEPNGMTVYTFTKDVKDSGKSNCTGGCIDDVAGADRAGRRDPDRRGRRDRQARDDHPRRRDARRSPTTACRSTSSRTTRRPATPTASTRTGRPSSPDGHRLQRRNALPVSPGRAFRFAACSRRRPPEDGRGCYPDVVLSWPVL